jgi:hypothetical protein
VKNESYGHDICLLYKIILFKVNRFAKLISKIFFEIFQPQFKKKQIGICLSAEGKGVHEKTRRVDEKYHAQFCCVTAMGSVDPPVSGAI